MKNLPKHLTFTLLILLICSVGIYKYKHIHTKQTKEEITKQKNPVLQTSPKKLSHPPGHACNPYPLSKVAQDTNRKWPGYREKHETKIPKKETKKDQKEDDDVVDFIWWGLWF